AAGSITACRIDLRFTQRVRQQARAVGEILQQIDVHIKGEEKGLILRPQRALQKLAARILLERQHTLLAARSVKQNAQGKRQTGFGHKALQRLRHLVFIDCAIVFGEVRNKLAALVFYGEEKVDQVDGHLERRRRSRIRR